MIALFSRSEPGGRERPLRPGSMRIPDQSIQPDARWVGKHVGPATDLVFERADGMSYHPRSNSQLVQNCALAQDFYTPPYGLDFHNGRALRNSQDGRIPESPPLSSLISCLGGESVQDSRTGLHSAREPSTGGRSTGSSGEARRQARCDTGCFSLQSRWSTSNDPPELSRRPSRTVALAAAEFAAAVGSDAERCRQNAAEHDDLSLWYKSWGP